LSNYKKTYKNKPQSIEVFSTNLSEDFYLYWIYYSIFDSTPNLSFFENKVREDSRLKMTFLN
jgi:hypothetical protein